MIAGFTRLCEQGDQREKKEKTLRGSAPGWSSSSSGGTRRRKTSLCGLLFGGESVNDFLNVFRKKESAPMPPTSRRTARLSFLDSFFHLFRLFLITHFSGEESKYTVNNFGFNGGRGKDD